VDENLTELNRGKTSTGVPVAAVAMHAAQSYSKSSHTPVSGLADQSPSVIMEPVSQSFTASVESQVPSKVGILE